MSNDTMVNSLLTLFESNLQNDGVVMNVIPFDENIKRTELLCSRYGHQIIDIDPLWDSLGKSLYGRKDYRTGVPAWRYFRKLNALMHRSGPLAFLDANVVIVGSLKDIVPALGKVDFIFGGRSVPGRNFTPLGKFIVNCAMPGVNNGFNAGFWMTKAGVLDLDVFRKMLLHPELRLFLKKAPEQSVLSLAIALQRRKAELIGRVVDGAAHQLAAERADESKINVRSADDVTYDGKKVYTIKWTGRRLFWEENGKCARLCNTFRKAGIERIKDESGMPVWLDA